MLTERPWDPDAHFEAAREFLARGNSVATRQEAVRAGLLGGDRPGIALLVGITMLIEGRDEQVIAVLDPANTRGSNEAAVFLAAAHARRGNLDEARRLAGSLRGSDKAPVWFWHAAAILSAGLGGIDRAIEHCLRAIKIGPQFFPSRLVLADLYGRQGKLDQAESCLRGVYAEQPRSAAVIRCLADLLEKRGRQDEARRILQQAAGAGEVSQARVADLQEDARTSDVSGNGSLVAWRCSLLVAGARYAGIVRELTFSAAALANKRRIRPASAVLGIMASSGGTWPPAQADLRQVLQKAYDQLGLKFASISLERASSGRTGECSEKSSEKALTRYLAPPEHVYELDETYQDGVEALRAGRWEKTIGLLARALQGYRRAGGLHDLHAGDCLLNMSTAAARLDRRQEAAEWAAGAQLLYERWARLPDAAKAMLNRVAMLYGQGDREIARRLAADCEAVANRGGLVSAAVDARAAGLAIESGLRPRPQLLKRIDRLERHYAGAADDARRTAFQRCRMLAKENRDLAVARQTVTLILRQAVKKGAPEGFEPLKKVLQRRPEAARVLLETSFLALSAKAWPVLAEAVAYVVMWLEGGSLYYGPRPYGEQPPAKARGDGPDGPRDLPAHTEGSADWLADRLILVERAVRMWMSEGEPSLKQLGEVRPSLVTWTLSGLAARQGSRDASPELSAGRAGYGLQRVRISLDAAKRTAVFAMRWEEVWSREVDECACLSQLCAAGSIVATRYGERDLAIRLTEGAYAARGS